MALGLLALSSCAYTYGEARKGQLPRQTYDGVGWDGDLAYGAAMAHATRGRGHVEDPDYVDMNCSMYGFKVLAAGLGGLLAGWAASEGHAGAAVGVGFGTLAVAVIPNCFATIGYHDRAPTPPKARPPVSRTAPDPSMRQEKDADEAEEEAKAPPPPAPNQLGDREGPPKE